jgi:hypothetical protein
MSDISNTYAELVQGSCSFRFAVMPVFPSFVLDVLVGNVHGSAECEDAPEPADKNADGGYIGKAATCLLDWLVLQGCPAGLA